MRNEYHRCEKKNGKLILHHKITASKLVILVSTDAFCRILYLSEHYIFMDHLWIYCSWHCPYRRRHLQGNRNAKWGHPTAMPSLVCCTESSKRTWEEDPAIRISSRQETGKILNGKLRYFALEPQDYLSQTFRRQLCKLIGTPYIQQAFLAASYSIGWYNTHRVIDAAEIGNTQLSRN